MVLETIWFFLWGLLWAVFFVTDGFDLGIGTIYPFLGKNDEEKRIMINSLGPLWDGNEVWLITAGGVTFAAFPLVYSVMFSTLYTPLMLILFALIIRGVSFEFRGLSEKKSWKGIWDTTIFAGSFLPSLLFGVAFANIFQGIPIDGKGIMHGNLFTLLNPYGIIGGLLFVSLFVVHGLLWICIRGVGELEERAKKIVGYAWIAELLLALGFLGASYVYTELYDNYFKYPVLWIIPIFAAVSLLLVRVFIWKNKFFAAWGFSASSIFFCTFFGVAGLFPNLFPSCINPEFSLTAFNASSSPLTLKIMLGVVIVFIPIVIAYQFFAYKMFSTKVDTDDFTY
ncbi:MAG: cytochrome d ubiquinol oxidase subunit II [Deltaproteobacteria bacterium]|nr:MAG: cytochrome d ubiquinol oxidase subunit II [Deltaproteobacteria bacterium]